MRTPNSCVALVDRERHDAVDADRGQHDRDDAEDREHHRDDAVLARRSRPAGSCGVPTKYSGRFGSTLLTSRRSALRQRRRPRWPPRGLTMTVANWLANGVGERRTGDARVERHVEARVVDARVVERPQHADRRHHADDRAPRPELLACRRRRCGSGGRSALSRPKCFCANAALTIATGCFASRSSSVKSRPSSSFWPVHVEVAARHLLEVGVRPVAVVLVRLALRSRSGRCRRRPCGSGW